MEYVAALVSLIVAMVGIHGSTWNSNGKGWRKLTPTGLAAAICALAAFGASITIEMSREDENKRARDQRRVINQIAEMEICLATASLKVAVDVMATAATGRSTSDGSDLGHAFAILTDAATIDALGALDLLTPLPARPRVGDNRDLDEFVSALARIFIDQTNMTLAKYSTFLERDLILKSTWLVNHNVVRRFLVTAEQVRQVRLSNGERYPAIWPHERAEYVEAIELMKDIFRLSGAANEGLACRKPEAFELRQEPKDLK